MSQEGPRNLGLQENERRYRHHKEVKEMKRIEHIRALFIFIVIVLVVAMACGSSSPAVQPSPVTNAVSAEN